jgi:hypothetical protein
MMRTTVNLPDDVYEIIRSITAAKGVSFGDAIAELVRKGLRPESRFRDDPLFPCFSTPESAAPITLEQTLEAEDQL